MALMLAGFYALMEWKGWQPLGVSTGCRWHELNCHLCDELDDGGLLGRRLDRHFGRAISALSGPTFQPVIHGFPSC